MYLPLLFIYYFFSFYPSPPRSLPLRERKWLLHNAFAFLSVILRFTSSLFPSRTFLLQPRVFREIGGENSSYSFLEKSSNPLCIQPKRKFAIRYPRIMIIIWLSPTNDRSQRLSLENVGSRIHVFVPPYPAKIFWMRPNYHLFYLFPSTIFIFVYYSFFSFRGF